MQDKFRFSTFCFQYVAYLVQFMLSVIPEQMRKVSYEILVEVSHLIQNIGYIMLTL